ncbi:DUF6392 family protein [Pseudomonas sp. BBP2017]|uniref:DUF6392 family protein n=1 Tax=Pseudomonas sp. BBP2017 TaxID=2109731 RepID=UPI000D4564BD|nr:DUF6392 family protein [Pseudomonas sp. BBP2017]PSS57378.1 hypothetical protein C6382_10770 [Pseudomonas sp. BBP2017]
MNNSDLDIFIRSLGSDYEQMVKGGLIKPSAFIEVCPEPLTLYLEPEAGVSFGFWAETKIFEFIHFTMKPVTQYGVMYAGSLPEPYQSSVVQSKVREEFGEPFRSKAPFTMPEPFGPVGGLDAYDLTALGYKNTQVVFKYDTDFNVIAVVFSLIERSRA